MPKWLLEEVLSGILSNMKITSLAYTADDGVLRVEAQSPMPVMCERIEISLSAK